jgi:hypothetical protein
MKKISLFLISIIYIIFFFFYPNIIKQNMIDVCLVFVFQVMPSILPIYLFSNILISCGILGKLSFILNKIFHFENEYSCSIYLLSILVGNPTTSILINQEINNHHISQNEGIRLMKFTCFVNPLFLLNTCRDFFILLFLSMIITSIIIGYFSPNKNVYNSPSKYHLSINSILDNIPNMMLNILLIMIVISIIKSPLSLLSGIPIITYLGDLLEISSGIHHIINSNNLFLICLLVYSNGLCIFLQTIQVSSFIKPLTFCLYRLIYLILASSITLSIHFLFYC